MVLIHQIRLGKKVPPLNQECLNSWHRLKDRDFEVVSWTDRRVNDQLATMPVAARTLYATARNFGEASDILRMAIAYRYGGLYVDWDVLLVDPDRFLEVVGDLESSSCVLIEDRLTKEPNFSCVYDNSLFYMRQGNPMALDFLTAVQDNYSKHPVPNTPYLTGPLALTEFLDSHPTYKRECRMVNMLDIYALDYEDVVRHTKDHTQRAVLKEYVKPNGAPAVHFWMHTWYPKRTRREGLLQKLARAFRRTTGSRDHEL